MMFFLLMMMTQTRQLAHVLVLFKTWKLIQSASGDQYSKKTLLLPSYGQRACDVQLSNGAMASVLVVDFLASKASLMVHAEVFCYKINLWCQYPSKF